MILHFLDLFKKLILQNFRVVKNPSVKHSGFLFLFTILFFQIANATLGPRMRSTMIQLSGGSGQFTLNPNSDYFAHNGSVDILYLNRLGGPSFGLRASMENRNNTGSVETGNSFSCFLGFYLQRGAFLVAGYEFQSNLGRWKNGTGSFVELGYLEHIGGQIHVGVKYTGRSTIYKTDSMDPAATRREISDAYPSLLLTYLL